MQLQSPIPTLRLTMPPLHRSYAAAAVVPESRVDEPPLFLLAAGAGFGVAALYYSQPILGVLMADLHASERIVGLVPTLTQMGYALGILFLAPLGDKLERRRLILVKSLVLALALLLCAGAPDVGWLLFASLVVGLSSTVAQDIVPAAAILSPAVRRGKAVGTVMTGLLLGILLSRVVGGPTAPGQRGGGRLWPGRSGRGTGCAAGRARVRPAQPAMGHAHGRRADGAVLCGHGSVGHAWALDPGLAARAGRCGV